MYYCDTTLPTNMKPHNLCVQKKKNVALVDDEGRENNDVNDPLLLLTNDESKRRREPSLEAQVHTIMSTGIIMEN
jgi:hypothetical protein